jgi:hypothetical protein
VHLLKRVERYLRRSGTAPTTFGRLALRDPRFVFDLRHGRNIGVRMERRVNAWLDEQEQRLEAAGCKTR